MSGYNTLANLSPANKQYLGYGQQPDWMQMMGMFKGINPLVSMGAQAGGSLLSGIGGLLAGDSWGEKKLKGLYQYLDSLKSQPAISMGRVNALQPQFMQGMGDYANQLSVGASRRYGLDSGAATGEIQHLASARLAELMAQLRWQAMNMNAQRPLDIAQMQAGIGGRLA